MNDLEAELKVMQDTYEKELERKLSALYDTVIEARNMADFAAKKYLNLKGWITEQKHEMLKLRLKIKGVSDE